jgi:hypothetical protein
MTRTPQNTRELMAEYLSFTTQLATELLGLEAIQEEDYMRAIVEHALFVKRVHGADKLPEAFRKDVQAVSLPGPKARFPTNIQEWKDCLRYLLLNLTSPRGRRLGTEARLRDYLTDYRASMDHLLRKLDEYGWDAGDPKS